MKLVAAIFLPALLLRAEGTVPRAAAADYPAQAQAAECSLGAEFMVRSFSGKGQTFVVKDYLVVEVALYPPKGSTLLISNGQFTLRVNGKKRALLAQPPGFVAASLKHPDWEQRPRLIGSGSIGDAGVILGAPQQTDRFPGDPRRRLPEPPRAPEPGNPSGLDKPEPVRAEELVVETALPEGQRRGPVSGYLYFPHKGSAKEIRSLELLYQGSQRAAALKLR